MRLMTDVMAESKYCDTLLNLRNSSVNTMKSYYTNSIEKHRMEHSQHFKSPFDKYTHCLQTSPKTRKYECEPCYEPTDIRKPRCEPSPFSTNAYRHPENKLNSSYIFGTSPPGGTRLSSNVSSISSYANKLQQYSDHKIPSFESGNPIRKRTYRSISTHDEASDEYHRVDMKSHPNVLPRFKFQPYRNGNSHYHTNPNTFYPQKGDLDKPPYASNRPASYEQHRSVSTPCPLPCCAAFRYDAKLVENCSYYERRESLSPSYSPIGSSHTKKIDYADHMQSLSSREQGESSAFSPIRPSHIRRVRSTESGYSSESNGSHSVNCYKEQELCKNPKCCAMLDLNSPTLGHNVALSLESRISIDERQKELSRDHLRDHVTSEHPARTENTQRKYEHDEGGMPAAEYKECIKRELFHENTTIKEEPGESGSNRYRESVNSDAWREHINRDKYRKYFNVENLSRPHTKDEDSRRLGNRHKPGSEFIKYKDSWNMPSPTNDNKLEVCDEASRAAMKAFDAHIRKMIAMSRDRNSSEYLAKVHHSINQSNHSLDISIENRHSYNQKCEYDSSKRQPHGNEEPSENNSDEKASPSSPNDKKEPVKPADESNKSTDNPDSLIRTSKEKVISPDEPIDEKKPIDESDTSDHKVNEKCIDEKDKLSTDILPTDESKTTKAKNEPPSPQPELQCSAVDSTLSDDASSPRTTEVGGLLGLTRVANEHLGQALAKEKKRSKNNNCLHLWQFLRRMLDQEQDKVGRCIEWTNRETGEFRLIKTAVIADLWGQSKNRTCMTYEKMARAMRYYYKMNILEKVPHKRLHFRFGERILSKVLNPTNTKPFVPRNKIFDDMYNFPKRNMNTGFASKSILKPSNTIVNDYRNGHSLNYLSIRADHGKNTIPYLPTELPGVTLPPYYNEHASNILHHNLPHIATKRMSEIATSRELVQKRIEPKALPPPCSISHKIVANSLHKSPGSNPSVSPYSGEETPETWSDIDSNDELVVDTDSE